MRRSSKIICSFCEEKFWNLQRFYVHMQVCKERKKWKDEKPCWETKLQGGSKKR